MTENNSISVLNMFFFVFIPNIRVFVFVFDKP